MTMRRTIAVIIRLAEGRAIANYAIAGAVAALNYIQPFLTEDLDILISTDGFEKHRSGLLLLGPIEKALAEMLARIQAFLEQDAVDLGRLKTVLERHDLMGAWKAFCLKAAISNPL